MVMVAGTGEPVTEAPGESEATGQQKPKLSHEICLQADHANLVRIEDLPVHARTGHLKPR